MTDRVCTAELDAEYPHCDRCGLAWDPMKPKPACKPMTFTRFREIIEQSIKDHQESGDVCAKLRSPSHPANPVVSYTRAAELRGVRLLMDRVLTNDDILKILRAPRRD